MGAFQDKEKLLKDAGIEVTLRNNDQHFICFKNGAFVDYWPKTGVFIDRGSNTKRNGIKELVAFFDAIASMSYRIASAMMKERAVNHG